MSFNQHCIAYCVLHNGDKIMICSFLSFFPLGFELFVGLISHWCLLLAISFMGFLWLRFLISFQEFKCEICGNYSYWGRRAFERHFKEWRHQHGMRCLGIPNTKNFNEITSIEVCFCRVFFFQWIFSLSLISMSLSAQHLPTLVIS